MLPAHLRVFRKPFMRYKSGVFFLVKGDVSCEKIVGDERSFILCKDRGYLLREVVTSNTILVRKKNRVSPVRVFLEVVDFVKDDLCKYMQTSTNKKMVGYSVDELKLRFMFGDQEFEDTAKQLFLLVSSESVYRLDYSFLLSISSYIRSLKLTGSDLETGLMIYNELISSWACKNITGSKEEICIFFMLKCLVSSSFTGWKKELEDILLEQVTLNYVKTALNESDILCSARASILGSLGLD